MVLLTLFACTDHDPGSERWLTPKGPPNLPDPHAVEVEDVFVEVARTSELDVLVALDPNPATWQAFEEVIPGLLASFDAVDPRWRVAFTTTSLSGDEPGWLATTGVDGGRWLSREDLAAPSVDWTGAPTEAPLGATGATFQAIDLDPYGFRRPDAAFQIILVTHGPDDTPGDLITFGEWTEWIGAEDAVVFGAVPEGDPLRDVIETTGGVAGNPDESLDPWSTQVAIASQSPRLPYFLSAIPVRETMDVTIEDPEGRIVYLGEAVGDPPVGDWMFDAASNAVRLLAYVPEDGSIVRARYVPLGAFHDLSFGP